MLFRALIPWVAAVALHAASEIPDRPEKLSFPTLRYEAPDPAQYRVPLRSGPVAYVVPDRELPLVTIQVVVRTGAYLDPAGREGLAGFAGSLLVRGGAGDRTAEALEERLAFLAAQLGASVGGDSGTVSLNLLSKDLDEGLRLLRDVLTAPRFQADKVELRRQQILQELKQRNDDSSDIEARELAALAHGPEFWAAKQPTGPGILAITRDDLAAFHRRWFHPANFTVAASGDFDRDAMVRKLEALFADWPWKGEVPPPIPDKPRQAAPGIYLVDKDVPQGRVSVIHPGVLRENPDYPAIQVMNDILGGGGFTARIMSRVRDDEGLAYSAGSSFPGGTWYPSTFQASFQSKSRTVAYATSIVLEEMRKIASAPVTQSELDTAKRSFIDTFPENFNTKVKVAGIFARDEFTGRFAKDPTFWQKYRQRLEAVSAADVQRVATKYLQPDKVSILVVGKKDEILKPHPDHPVPLESLSGGGLHPLPLRDPLTLEPLPAKESKDGPADR